MTSWLSLWQADRHAVALTAALAEWAAGPAFHMAQLERDRLLLRLADQILFRFTKLQDALGGWPVARSCARSETIWSAPPSAHR